MLIKLVKLAVLVLVLAVIVQSVPDIQRYLRMRAM
jgi:hypothetical protein